MKEKVYLFETSYYKTAYTIVSIILVALTLIPIFTKKYFLFFLPVMFVIFAFNGLKMIFAKDINNNKNKNFLLKNGQRVEGKIVGFKKHKMLEQLIGQNVSGVEKMDSDVYTLMISFNDTIFETPTIMYDPKRYFTTDKCDVYIDGEKMFATNFNSENTEFEIKEYIEENLDD